MPKPRRGTFHLSFFSMPKNCDVKKTGIDFYWNDFSKSQQRKTGHRALHSNYVIWMIHEELPVIPGLGCWGVTWYFKAPNWGPSHTYCFFWLAGLWYDKGLDGETSIGPTLKVSFLSLSIVICVRQGYSFVPA